MNKIKNTIIISSYILFAALLFSGAYVIGRTGSGVSLKKAEKATYEEAVDAVSENTVQAPVYEVKAENGKIIIYKCIGDLKTVITSDEISEQVFPKKDIEELSEGIKFERLESAQRLFENFVS